MSEENESGPVPRGQALAEARKRKMDALFGDGRKYEVVRKITMPREAPRFKTPLGQSGYEGWLIRQIAGPPVTDPIFEDLDPRGFIFGAQVITQIHDQYDALELPFELQLKEAPVE